MRQTQKVAEEIRRSMSAEDQRDLAHQLLAGVSVDEKGWIHYGAQNQGAQTPSTPDSDPSEPNVDIRLTIAERAQRYRQLADRLDALLRALPQEISSLAVECIRHLLQDLR